MPGFIMAGEFYYLVNLCAHGVTRHAYTRAVGQQLTRDCIRRSGPSPAIGAYWDPLRPAIAARAIVSAAVPSVFTSPGWAE